MTSFWRVIFWAAATFTFVMALLPQPPQLPGSPSDKVQHIVAFGVLGGLSSVAYPAASVASLLIGLSVFGAAIELLQAIPALNRDSDPVDWLADTIAAAVVLGLMTWWQGRHEAR